MSSLRQEPWFKWFVLLAVTTLIISGWVFFALQGSTIEPEYGHVDFKVMEWTKFEVESDISDMEILVANEEPYKVEVKGSKPIVGSLVPAQADYPQADYYLADWRPLTNEWGEITEGGKQITVQLRGPEDKLIKVVYYNIVNDVAVIVGILLVALVIALVMLLLS